MSERLWSPGALYNRYLVADYVVKKAEKIGVPLMTVNFYGFKDMIYVAADEYYRNSEEMISKREGWILALLEEIPGSYTDRENEKVSVFFERRGLKVGWLVGQALCERVQTGTVTKRVVDPEFEGEIPMVEVVEPVYEWRCSDDILGSMKHKEVV